MRPLPRPQIRAGHAGGILRPASDSRPAFDPERWLKPNERAIEIGLRSEREAHKRRTDEVERDFEDTQGKSRRLTAPFRKQLLDENLAQLDASLREAMQKALDTKEKQRTEEMKSLLKTNAALVDISADALQKKFPAFAAAAEPIKEALKKREAGKPAPLDRIAATFEPANAAPVHHLLSENHAREGKESLREHPRFNTVIVTADETEGNPDSFSFACCTMTVELNSRVFPE